MKGKIKYYFLFSHGSIICVSRKGGREEERRFRRDQRILHLLPVERLRGGEAKSRGLGVSRSERAPLAPHPSRLPLLEL